MNKLSNRLRILHEEYPGDNAWKNFVDYYPSCNAVNGNQVKIDEDMIKVIYFKKSNNIERMVKWLSEPVPALDGKTPIEVYNLSEGRIIFRTLLMRMPE